MLGSTYDWYCMNSDQDLRAKFTLAEKLFLEKKTQESINLYREILLINDVDPEEVYGEINPENTPNSTY